MFVRFGFCRYFCISFYYSKDDPSKKRKVTIPETDPNAVNNKKKKKKPKCPRNWDKFITKYEMSMKVNEALCSQTDFGCEVYKQLFTLVLEECFNTIFW